MQNGTIYDKERKLNQVEENLNKFERFLKQNHKLKINGISSSCNRRKLSVQDWINQFKNKFHEFAGDLQNIIGSAKTMDTSLTQAENKVNDLKGVLNLDVGGLVDKLTSGSEERRLSFNPVADIKNLYGDLKNAREKTHEMIQNYEQGEKFAHDFKTGYDTVLKLKESIMG